MAKKWGLCKQCKWWQLEPRARVANDTLGLCIEEKIWPYRLRCSGDSGCNRFIKGDVARAKGSSKAPPTAKQSR